MKKITKIADGFKNILKGLGGERDPREYSTFQKGKLITQQTANDLYVYNWLARKVVDIPVDDATRKWRTVLIPEQNTKDDFEELSKELEVKDKVNLALKWSKVFGGSLILMIIDDNSTDQSEPIDLENIQKDSLKNLIVLDRYNIYPTEINRWITSANYGKPEYYMVARTGERIHHTRVIKFDGETSTIQEYERQNFWGNSIFTKGFDTISDSQTVSNSIANLIHESNVDVYKIEGLNELVAMGSDELVKKRLQLAHEMKSIINGIALDGADGYEKKSNTFANLDSIDDRFIQKVAGTYDIPVTRLLGISPSGQNSTGESDMLNYEDKIESIQENTLRPVLEKLDSVMFQSLTGRMDQVEFEFKPLRHLTEVEQAQVDLNTAQRDQIYFDLGAVNQIDIQAQLAEEGTYISIDEERVEQEKADFEEEQIEFEKEEQELQNQMKQGDPEPEENNGIEKEE